MTNLSLKNKHKSRIGPKDFKRNSRARRDGDRAIGFIFVSMLASLVSVNCPFLILF